MRKVPSKKRVLCQACHARLYRKILPAASRGKRGKRLIRCEKNRCYAVASYKPGFLSWAHYDI